MSVSWEKVYDKLTISQINLRLFVKSDWFEIQANGKAPMFLLAVLLYFLHGSCNKIEWVSMV